MQDLTYVLKGVNDPVNKGYISHYECYLVAPVKNNIYHKSRMLTQRWYLFGMWHWIVKFKYETISINDQQDWKCILTATHFTI